MDFEENVGIIRYNMVWLNFSLNKKNNLCVLLGLQNTSIWKKMSNLLNCCVRIGQKERQLDNSSCFFLEMLITLPLTSSSHQPGSRAPKRKESSSNHPFSGPTLSFRKGNFQQKDKYKSPLLPLNHQQLSSLLLMSEILHHLGCIKPCK